MLRTARELALSELMVVPICKETSAAVFAQCFNSCGSTEHLAS